MAQLLVKVRLKELKIMDNYKQVRSVKIGLDIDPKMDLKENKTCFFFELETKENNMKFMISNFGTIEKEIIAPKKNN